MSVLKHNYKHVYFVLGLELKSFCIFVQFSKVFRQWSKIQNNAIIMCKDFTEITFTSTETVPHLQGKKVNDSHEKQIG